MGDRHDERKPFEIAPSLPDPRSQPPRANTRWVLIAALASIAAAAAYVYLFERPRLARWLEGTPIAIEPTVTTAYKWQNHRGEWQITDRPPPDGTPFETLRVRSDTNVLPALPDEN